MLLLRVTVVWIQSKHKRGCSALQGIHDFKNQDISPQCFVKQNKTALFKVRRWLSLSSKGDKILGRGT